MSIATFTVDIDDDMTVEETECFEIVLSSPSNGSLADCQITTTICIKDDDTMSKWCLFSFIIQVSKLKMIRFLIQL